MKPVKIITSFLIIIALTGCVGQQEKNIDEFLKKFNLIGNETLTSSMFDVTESNDYYIYSLLHSQNLICIYSGKDGVVLQCTVTSKSPTDSSFDELCINITACFTDYDKQKSADFYKNGGDCDRYHLFINDYGIGKTMILNLKSNEINSNDYPTLKRPVDEKDIARPTLNESTTIKQ